MDPTQNGIRFAHDLCSDLDFAEHREWLVTNGRGSYASGTVGNLLTRGYHGLLVAALTPPVGRTLIAGEVGRNHHLRRYRVRSFYEPLARRKCWPRRARLY